MKWERDIWGQKVWVEQAYPATRGAWVKGTDGGGPKSQQLLLVAPPAQAHVIGVTQ